MKKNLFFIICITISFVCTKCIYFDRFIGDIDRFMLIDNQSTHNIAYYLAAQNLQPLRGYFDQPIPMYPDTSIIRTNSIILGEKLDEITREIGKKNRAYEYLSSLWDEREMFDNFELPQDTLSIFFLMRIP